MLAFDLSLTDGSRAAGYAAGNAVSICFSHMGWVEDALTILFAHQKNDQEGVRSQEKRHVFPNPLMPAVCAVLALAIYLSCTGFEAGQKLFSGSSQYDRYSRSLQRVLQVPRIAAQLVAIGKEAGDFGTHSVRKGAATYCCSGSTAAPPISAVRIRVGWVTPGVEDTYIRFEAAGDQFVGRTVAGHDLNSVNFGILPPFFPVAARGAALDSAINQCFPGAPAGMRGVLEHCLASILYHKEYLLRTLKPGHRLLNTVLFTRPQDFEALRMQVICRRHQIGDPMQPTGTIHDYSFLLL